MILLTLFVGDVDLLESSLEMAGVWVCVSIMFCEVWVCSMCGGAKRSFVWGCHAPVLTAGACLAGVSGGWRLVCWVCVRLVPM